MPISVVMISLNNMATLPGCLASLDFADEIVVVDGGSTDGTLDYLRTYTDGYDLRLIEHKWPNDFSKQRQVSFDEAMCGDEWFWLRVDTDEVMPGLFRENIRRLLEGLPPEIVACRIKQANLYGDREHYAASHGGWETWPRIWRADRDLRWEGHIHERVVWLKDGKLEDIPEERIANLNLTVLHDWTDLESRASIEERYIAIPGSGFTEKGDWMNRKYVVREVPPCFEC